MSDDTAGHSSAPRDSSTAGRSPNGPGPGTDPGPGEATVPTVARGRRTVALLRAMAREEWRLHSRLFGGGRFAAFPLVVLVLAAGAVELLGRVGTDLGATVLGLHALVAFVGLQTGTIGLVSRDAVDSLVGDVTFLLSASRTLPLSRRGVVAAFLVKDLAYYAGYFLLPIAFALVPAVLRGTVAPAAVPRLWLSTTLTFATGSAVTLAAIALRSRGRVGRVALVGLVAGVTVLAVGSATGRVAVDLARYTPYALYADAGSLGDAVLAVGPTAVLAVVGVYGADPEYAPPSRTAGNDFAAWRARLGDDDGLLVKTLLDVRRSDGGFLKVGFSAAVVLAVAVALVSFAGRVTGRTPATGVSVGALLGLTAFTTYNWLASFDSVDAYRHLPVDVAAVFRAKRRGFLLLGPAVGLLAYAVAVAWLGTTLLDAVAGAVLSVGVQLYLYGVTTYVAGLRPNEFLFDPVLFVSFTVAVAAVLVPTLVVGFVVPVTTGPLLGLVVGSVVVGAVGETLARRAPRRWTEAYRR